ncbi:Uncharacterized protein Fot_25237 [Forsythia ovata]|uniref:Uncharacterized protein n=1 Tax=Forsythia ovata TaxID=205694 RepID=A0ABD1U8I1_9LAMI
MCAKIDKEAQYQNSALISVIVKQKLLHILLVKSAPSMMNWRNHHKCYHRHLFLVDKVEDCHTKTIDVGDQELLENTYQSKKSINGKDLLAFKFALVDLVKDLLKPKWKVK